MVNKNKKSYLGKITVKKTVITLIVLAVLYLGYVIFLTPHIEKAAINAAKADIKLPHNYTLVSSLYYPNTLCLDTCTNEVIKYVTNDDATTVDKVIKNELVSVGYKKASEADFSHDYIDKKYDTKKIKAWYGVEGTKPSALVANQSTGQTLTVVLSIDNNNE